MAARATDPAGRLSKTSEIIKSHDDGAIIIVIGLPHALVLRTLIELERSKVKRSSAGTNQHSCSILRLEEAQTALHLVVQFYSN